MSEEEQVLEDTGDGDVVVPSVEELQAAVTAQAAALREREEELAAIRAEIDEARQRLALAVAKYRLLALERQPQIPAELVSGETVEEVDRSLATARALVERVRRQLEAETQSRRVPVGSPGRQGADVSALSPRDKIAYALAREQG